MKAIDLYIKTSGNKIPDNQIAYYEWHQEYVKWLESQVEILSALRVDENGSVLNFKHSEDVPLCSCSEKDKHGETSVMCCNECGKPIEKFWCCDLRKTKEAEISERDKFIADFVEKRMKNNTIPYGMQYMALLDSLIGVAEREYKRKQNSPLTTKQASDMGFKEIKKVDNLKDYQPEIGEIVDFRGTLVKCVEGISCLNCAFNDDEYRCGEIVRCGGVGRTDGTRVFFIKVDNS